MDASLQYGIVGLLGLVFGSFLNSVIYRIPRGISVVRGRSFCVHCQRSLPWTELVPLLSFVIQRGRCTACGKPIPVRYPLIELLSASVLALFFLRSLTFPAFVGNAIFALAMISIAVIDWECFIVPDWILGVSFAFICTIRALTDMPDVPDAVVQALAASFFLSGIRAIGSRLFGRESMGLGDVKLAAILGFGLGLQWFFIVLWLAALGGTIYGVLRAKGTESNVVAFGSFLAVSSILVLLLKPEVNQILTRWIMLLQ